MIQRTSLTVLLAVLILFTAAIGQEKKPPTPGETTVKVLVPNGGEKWTEASTQIIAWELFGAVTLQPDSVQITLVRKGALAIENNVLLASLIKPDAKKWDWMKIGPMEENLRIEVKAFFPEKKTSKDMSDKSFAIVTGQDAVTPKPLPHDPMPHDPTIKVIAPNGSEAWEEYSNQIISWELPGMLVLRPDSVKIGLVHRTSKKDDESKPKTTPLVTLVRPETNQWEWTKIGPAEENLRIEVKAFFPQKKSAKDISDKTFIIASKGVTPPPAPPRSAVTVTVPNGGEKLKVGATVKIMWTYQITPSMNIPVPDLPPSRYVITLSRDGGLTYEETIARGLNNTLREYVWKVDGAASERCLVKVSLTGQQNPALFEDINDSFFSISSDVEKPKSEGTQH
jgi:hypothetical protein